MQSFKHTELTEQIIGAFFEVYNTLGFGFLEKNYENALAIELRNRGLAVEQQAPIVVKYAGQVIGEYFADLVVAGQVIIELKAAKSLTADHEAQLLNYLKATEYEVGLLLNFGPKASFKRKAFDNDRKGARNWTNREP